MCLFVDVTDGGESSADTASTLTGGDTDVATPTPKRAAAVEAAAAAAAAADVDKIDSDGTAGRKRSSCGPGAAAACMTSTPVPAVRAKVNALLAKHGRKADSDFDHTSSTALASRIGVHTYDPYASEKSRDHRDHTYQHVDFDVHTQSAPKSLAAFRNTSNFISRLQRASRQPF